MHRQSNKHHWLTDPANFPLMLLALAVAALIIAAGAYLWITRIEPAVSQLAGQATPGVPFL
jgi:hypothetical protein